MFYFFLNKHLKSSGVQFAHSTYPLLKEIKDWKGSVSQRQQSHPHRENIADEDHAGQAFAQSHAHALRKKLASVHVTK